MTQAALETYSTMPSVSAPPVDMDALATLYRIEDQEGVQKYLTGHPFATPLLLAAPAHIARIFGPDVSPRLEIEHDPEWVGRRYLWVLIAADLSTNQHISAAEARLRRLHDEWLFCLPRNEAADVNFDVEPD